MLDHNKLYIATIKDSATRNTQAYYGTDESAPLDSEGWQDCDAPLLLNICFVNNPTEESLKKLRESIASSAGLLPCFVELKPLVEHCAASTNASDDKKSDFDDKLLSALLDAADTIGWTANEDDDGWDMRKPSPAGEDFGFFIDRSKIESAEDFVRLVRIEANKFDAEEHIMLFVENAGKNGTPDIRTLVQDADDIQEMLDRLADTLEAVKFSAKFFA